MWWNCLSSVPFGWQDVKLDNPAVTKPKKWTRMSRWNFTAMWHQLFLGRLAEIFPPKRWLMFYRPGYWAWTWQCKFLKEIFFASGCESAVSIGNNPKSGETASCTWLMTCDTIIWNQRNKQSSDKPNELNENGTSWEYDLEWLKHFLQ